MKNISNYYVLLVFLLLPVTNNAQSSSDNLERGSIHPGYIITIQGDTVKGYILNINLWLNQRMTFLYTNPDDREGRVKYTPKEIKAYKVGPRYYESFHRTFTNSIRADNFMLRKVDGPIKYYVWYFDENKSKLMFWDKISLSDLTKAFLMEEGELWKDEFAMKESETALTEFNLKFLMKFSKNMFEYVKDYPELAQKITGKQEGYKNINIENIIKEYNLWYLGNH
jgi:hypothetical protein